jgi:hypothetical protein
VNLLPPTMRPLLGARQGALCLALFGFVVAYPAEAGAQTLPTLQSLPQEVQAAIQEAVRTCKPENATLKWGFISAKDVNDDGVDDYILDYGQFECGARVADYCGSAGCLTQVFVSLSNGKYIKVMYENVRDLRFAHDTKGRPEMLLNLHGSYCGKDGATPCSSTSLWNGHTFAPVGDPRVPRSVR